VGGSTTSFKQRKLAMNDFNLTNFAPKGWQTVTARLVVDDASQLVEFLKQVFNATGEYRQDRPSEIRIGDSIVMIGNAGIRKSITSFLYVYVKDADAASTCPQGGCAFSRRTIRHSLW
jgi:hypothetical protein